MKRIYTEKINECGVYQYYLKPDYKQQRMNHMNFLEKN